MAPRRGPKLLRAPGPRGSSAPNSGPDYNRIIWFYAHPVSLKLPWEVPLSLSLLSITRFLDSRFPIIFSAFFFSSYLFNISKILDRYLLGCILVFLMLSCLPQGAVQKYSITFCLCEPKDSKSFTL